MAGERLGSVALATGVLLVTGCGEQAAGRGAAEPGPSSEGVPVWLAPARPLDGSRTDSPSGAVHHAVAWLRPAQGRGVTGWVRLEEEEGAVRLSAELEGLVPRMPYAVHVHEYGDCSAPDVGSAGERFPPQVRSAGADGTSVSSRHAGDLGRVIAREGGAARLVGRFESFSLTRERGVLGRAIVVHARSEDERGGPGGHASERIACGAIAAAEPTDRGTE